MRHTFHASQWVPYPRAQVFAFFSDPDNLPRLMPPWQRARIDHAFLIAPPLMPILRNQENQVAGKGSMLTISFRAVPLLPLRLTWKAAITEFEWNEHFCDEQQAGPLSYWKHCHAIATEHHDGTEGTQVTDNVTYSLPFGPLGDLANALAIKHQMKATFAFRQSRLTELLAER